MESKNIESKLSEDVIIDLEWGLFAVSTLEGLRILHTNYDGYSLEDLKEIERDEVHKKGFSALESLKEKNPQKYTIQRQYLEDNEKWFLKVYKEKKEYASNKEMVVAYAIVMGFDCEKAVEIYNQLYQLYHQRFKLNNSSWAYARTINTIYTSIKEKT